MVVDKDTNAAALGLALAGEDASGSFAYLHLGTGLGAGLVLGGALRVPVPERGSSGIRCCGWTGRCAGAGTAAASRRCASRPWPAATSTRPRESSAPLRATSWGCSTSTACCSAGGRCSPRMSCSYGVWAPSSPSASGGAGEAEVPVTLAPGGERAVAEGAAQLVLAPLFGRADAAPSAQHAGQDLN